MSVDLTLQSIQSTIDERKAKLEALKQKRIQRAKEEEAEKLSSNHNSNKKSIDDEADEFIASMKKDDEKNVVRNSVSFNITKDDTSTGGLSNSTLPLPNSSTSHRPSVSRASTSMRQSFSTTSTEQLYHIKQSFDTITQHQTTKEALTRRQSHATMGPSTIAHLNTNTASDTLSPPNSNHHAKSPSLDLTSISYSSNNNNQQQQQDASPLARNSIDTPSSTTAAASPTSPSITTGASAVIPTSSSITGLTSREEELLLQLESLQETIRSQDDDLALAGECGSQLLSANEDASRRIDELQISFDELQEQELEYKSIIRESERSNKKYHQEIKHLRDLNQEYESELEILKMENELDKTKYSTLETEIYKLKNEPSLAEKKLQELNIELNELKSLNTKLETQSSESKKQIDELQESIKNLTTINIQQTEELSISSKYRQQVQQLQEQLHILKAQDTVNVLAELSWEKNRLEDSLRELTKQYDILYESNLKDQELLRSLEGNRSSQQQSHHNKFASLADDEVLDENGFATSVLLNNSSSTPSARTSIDKTPTNSTTSNDDAERIRIATSAAAMAQQSIQHHTQKAHRSSLASGSASLSLIPTNSTGLTPPLNPTHSRDRSGSNSVISFISGLLPASSNSSNSSSTSSLSLSDPRRQSILERASHHPLEGGGAGDFDGPLLQDTDLHGKSSHATSFLGRKLGERDADWEFFSLTLLCVKIHCAKKTEFLLTVSTQDLWIKSKKENIQFHEYYKWLDDQLSKVRVNKLYEKSSGKSDPDLQPSNSAVPSADIINSLPPSRGGTRVQHITSPTSLSSTNSSSSSTSTSRTAPGSSSILSSTSSSASSFSQSPSALLSPVYGFDPLLNVRRNHT